MDDKKHKHSLIAFYLIIFISSLIVFIYLNTQFSKSYEKISLVKSQYQKLIDETEPIIKDYEELLKRSNENR
jgi:hypothetical protein